MAHVEEINDIKDLVPYRLLWNSLLLQTCGASFFHSFDWLETYWHHFGHDQKLRVLIVSVEGRPIGILPLVVRTESTRVGPVRVLTYPLHDWGTFYGPIGPNPTATLLAGLKHIRRTTRDWDLFDLRWVDRLGCDRGRTEQAMRVAGFRPHKQPWAQAGVIELDGTWEEYWKSRTKKWRHNVNRCQRRIAERGKVSYVRYRPKGSAYGDDDPRWDLYDACTEVAQRSWQGSSNNGTTLSHKWISQYLRDTHAAAARNGSLDMNVLFVDGVPVAFMYNYHYRGTLYGLRMGFDPEMASVGPGTVLLRLILEDSFRRGDRFCDLGTGSLCCKRYWLTSLAASYRYTHFPNTLGRAQLLRLKRWYTARVHGADHVASSRCAMNSAGSSIRKCKKLKTIEQSLGKRGGYTAPRTAGDSNACRLPCFAQ